LLNTARKTPLTRGLQDEPQRETEVSPLPENWRVAELGSLCLKTPAVDLRRDGDRNIEYVDVSSVSRRALRVEGSVPFRLRDAPSRARKQIQTGDVIFATVRPTLLRAAVVPLSLDNQVCSTAFCVLRRDPNHAVGGFIYYLVQRDAFVRQLANEESGANYPAVTDRVVKAQLVPVPPLEEQRAIVAALGRVRDALSAHERAVASVSELKRAAMRTLFTRGLRGEPQRGTEIGPIPESWDLVELEAVQESIRYGTSVRCSHRPTGFPVLRIPNIEAGRINTDNLKFCERHTVAPSRYELERGDLLFVRTNGVLGRLGACAVYDGAPRGALFASYLIRSRLMSDRVVPRFVAYFFGSEIGSRAIADRATPAADGKFNLNATTISGLPLLVPESLDEQREIVAILDALDRKAELHRRKRAVLDDLFKALLHKLMTGEIRVADLGLPEDLESVAS